jgi:glycosyltransferase involved in cell wall biosynthesis
MALALVTNYLTPYRVPLFAAMSARHDLEVLCFGGGSNYVPGWFNDLDRQLREAPFPARRCSGPREAFAVGSRYDAVIAPFAGGAILPATYLGARLRRRPFVLWASVWTQPRSLAHALALPLTRRVYRDADAVIAYGEHVRRFVARIRGHDEDVFVAPQAVETELFGRMVDAAETESFRARHGLGDAPLVLYVGRLVPEKGVAVLLEAWRSVRTKATLVLVGDGPVAPQSESLPGTRLLGPLPREELPVAYAAAELALLPSIPTPRFREPWGLVCNEAMLQARPVIATTSVGAVAGGLVQDEVNGVVVPPGQPAPLANAIDRLLGDDQLRQRLGQAGREAARTYTYDAMVVAFEQALAQAGAR